MKSLEKQAKQTDSLYAKPLIPDILVVKSRPFRSEIHESEYISSYGKVNDNIKEKYFFKTKLANGKEKQFSDHMRTAKGTNKLSENPQGYLGTSYKLII